MDNGSVNNSKYFKTMKQDNYTGNEKNAEWSAWQKYFVNEITKRGNLWSAERVSSSQSISAMLPRVTDFGGFVWPILFCYAGH